MRIWYQSVPISEDPKRMTNAIRWLTLQDLYVCVYAVLTGVGVSRSMFRSPRIIMLCLADHRLNRTCSSSSRKVFTGLIQDSYTMLTTRGWASKHDSEAGQEEVSMKDTLLMDTSELCYVEYGTTLWT